MTGLILRFHTPTQLLFGEGVAGQIGEVLAARDALGRNSNCRANPRPVALRDALGLLAAACAGARPAGGRA
jgi:hypothetical protein